ncbi:MAG: isoprenylcysteine carboxylmethyltransferase family protein [Planctomycetota bacterium]
MNVALASILRIGYFNWWLVGAYIVLVGIFLYGILKPRKKSEWKSAGIAQAWVIALYAEMYGLPLTAYLVMGWFGHSQAEAETHFNGHMWPIFFGLSEGNLVTAQFLCTVIGQTFILLGALLAVFGWRQLYSSVKKNELAENGLYRYIRHPQYTGFFLFLIGSVINWPTIATVATFPIICWVYYRLSITEEELALDEFGENYQNYMNRTGRFLPKFA